MYLIKSCQGLEVIVLAEVQHQCEQTKNLSIETKLQEEPMVVFSHTIVNPRKKEFYIRCVFKTSYIYYDIYW